MSWSSSPATREWDPPAGMSQRTGGATRSDSVRAGLALVPADADIVVVHDAARPLASRALFAAVIAAVRAGADAAVPALAGRRHGEARRRTSASSRPCRATISSSCRHRRRSAPTRCAPRTRGRRSSTDDAALVEAGGGTVVVVPGETRNLKITVPATSNSPQALLDTGSDR